MHIAHCRGNILHNSNCKVVSQCWSPKVSRCTMHIAKAVSQCGGGLFLPGLEGGAWWSSQEGRRRGTKELETQSLNSTQLTLHRTWMMMDEVWRHRKRTYSEIVNILLSSPGQSKLLENVHQVSRYVSASPAAAVTGIRPPPMSPTSPLPHIWPSLGHRFHIPAQTSHVLGIEALACVSCDFLASLDH